MANEIDENTADEAYRAFTSTDDANVSADEGNVSADEGNTSPDEGGTTTEDDNLDEWLAAVKDSGKDAATKDSAATELESASDASEEDEKRVEPEPEVPPEEPAPEGASLKTSVTDAVKLINKHMDRETAKKLTLPEYDDFDDVVKDGGVNPARLAEYTSVIPFWYMSFKDKKEKIGYIPKYPGFLRIFGVTRANDISVADVLKKFAPDDFERVMGAERDSELLAKAAAIIVARRGLDFSRKLDDEDYGVLESVGVKNPRRFRTVSEISGLGPEVLDYDTDSNVVYNPDYAAAANSAFGGEAPVAGDDDVVSMDDIMGGLDKNVFRSVFKRPIDDVHSVAEDSGKDTGETEGEGEESAPMFVPFHMPGSDAMKDIDSRRKGKVAGLFGSASEPDAEGKSGNDRW